MKAIAVLLAAPLLTSAVELSGSASLWKPFLDEEAGFAGGAALRMPVTRRIAIRPEVTGGSIQTYGRLMLLGTLTFDVTNPDAPAVGYIVGSAGLNYSRDARISYSYTESTALAGAGVRYYPGGRWVAGIEFRVGPDAFPLITASFGYRFGNKEKTK